MLDLDASFAFVPEFQSTRRRVAEKALLSHDGLFGADILTSKVFPAISAPECDKVALPVKPFDKADARAQPADADRAEDDLASLALADLRDAATESLFAATEADEDTSPVAPTEARAITPRRPLRFTPSRQAADATPVSLPNLNLFDGVFQTGRLDAESVDPRLLRSRSRALSRLAAHEASLPPEQRNLWHDDGAEEIATPKRADEPQAQPVTNRADDADTIQPRRPVRQIAVNRNATPRPEASPRIHDPLQDQLHRVREALYTPGAEDPSLADTAKEAKDDTALLRLATLVLHLAVMLFTLPGRLADRIQPLLPLPRRGHTLRLATLASLAAVIALVLVQGDPGSLS